MTTIAGLLRDDAGELISESCLATALVQFFSADLDANAPGHSGWHRSVWKSPFDFGVVPGLQHWDFRALHPFPDGPADDIARPARNVRSHSGSFDSFDTQPIHRRGGHETTTERPSFRVADASRLRDPQVPVDSRLAPLVSSFRIGIDASRQF